MPNNTQAMMSRSKLNKSPIVVTGMGVVSCLGHDTSTFWQQLCAGHSGIAAFQSFDATSYTTKFGGEIWNWDPSLHLPAKVIQRMDPFIHFGLVAAKEAIAQAKLDNTNHVDKSRIGVAVGSGIGGMSRIESSHQTLLEKGPRRVSPFFIPGSLINLLAGHISIDYGFTGPNFSAVSACATGGHNLGIAKRMLEAGDVDVMIVGGSEKGCTPLSVAGFNALRALSTRNDDPSHASRPWDQDRDGFVLADGAAILILETLEHAEQRGVEPLALFSGYAATADAHHITAPSNDGKSAYRAMSLALVDAGLQSSDIDYINAHATSTPLGDKLEINAINLLFSEQESGKPKISSTKSMTGHMLGAAAAAEAIVAVKALQTGLLPPTINLNMNDVSHQFDFVAQNQALQHKTEVVLSNSFGFGGTNVALLFQNLS